MPRLLLVVAVVLLVAVRGTGAPASFTIWPSTATPAIVADPETATGELGVKFMRNQRVHHGDSLYKASTNTGTACRESLDGHRHPVVDRHIHKRNGLGWQQVNLPTPVAIAANTLYVAWYHINVGHYSVDEKYFTGKGTDSPRSMPLPTGVGIQWRLRRRCHQQFPQPVVECLRLLGGRRLHNNHHG